MKILHRITDWLIAIPLLTLIVIFNVGVVMRYWFDAPLKWIEEVSGLLIVWIVMIGAIAADRDDQHLTIPLLVDLMAPRPAAFTNLIVSVASSAFLIYVGYTGYNLANQVTFKITEILGISWYWIDIAIPVGCVFIAFYTLRRGVLGFLAARRGGAR